MPDYFKMTDDQNCLLREVQQSDQRLLQRNSMPPKTTTTLAQEKFNPAIKRLNLQ
jgi:hypothetical protein